MNVHAAVTDDVLDLYRELILDHARSPRHFGRLANATHKARGINPLCGDKICVYLCIDDNARIEAISFDGSGCAISVASASLLTDAIIGLSADRAETIFSAVTERLTDGGKGQPGNIDVELDRPLEKIRALDGVREFPSRVKCATLAWHALRSALRQDAQPATTE
ncbi:MAG: SUF system NifU family Fe-S cluster assembly protein [Gammaproteobacteria bacterium]|nr:SUF system NifU family Fe-S cluster assembly protein [Gammaproteobacteria bacterium]MBT8111608.1 SUF system NifU family Fe-S cluster assembly protein [Gammaproteobacteria bacterium]NND48380.1 SUF system NifU family Fe-S cluster assembly protein [Woeseiaceae bacterium]NNL46306.1 SUF system NifU family Fe-S cluster assembly protein [Woeseiaceae bacterium]